MYPWLIPAWQRLQVAYLHHRLAQAWLFSGPNGMGKGALARSFANLLLCQHPNEASPCGTCHACRLLAHGNHPDLHFVGDEAARSIGVDAIREVSALMTRSPQLGLAKVVILSQCERMTESASNALLKTLEEPAGAGYLLLLADNPHQLLPTITSRCQKLPLQANEEEALAWLHRQPGGQVATGLHLRLNKGAPLQTLTYLQNGEDEERRRLCHAVEALLSQPWRLDEVVGLLGAQPAALGWLQLLLLDAVKYQQGVPLLQLSMADVPGLISALAAYRTSRLLQLNGALVDLLSLQRQAPLSSIHLLHWLNELVFTE